jgi:hypothetical protein
MDYNNREHCYRIIREMKIISVSRLKYEIAASLREIERTFFIDNVKGYDDSHNLSKFDSDKFSEKIKEISGDKVYSEILLEAMMNIRNSKLDELDI